MNGDPFSLRLSLAEAMQLAGCNSDQAFRRWCAKWRVVAARRRVYARRQIEDALEREEGVAAAAGRRMRRKAVAAA